MQYKFEIREKTALVKIPGNALWKKVRDCKADQVLYRYSMSSFKESPKKVALYRLFRSENVSQSRLWSDAVSKPI